MVALCGFPVDVHRNRRELDRAFGIARKCEKFYVFCAEDGTEPAPTEHPRAGGDDRGESDLVFAGRPDTGDAVRTETPCLLDVLGHCRHLRTRELWDRLELDTLIGDVNCQ